MAAKKNIGKIVSYKFQYIDKEIIYSGFLLDYNDDWTLLKYNSGDYIIDGYVVLKNKHITGWKRENAERFTQKILELKGEKSSAKEVIPITDIRTILEFLSKKYRAFTFYSRKQKACYLGNVKWIKGNDLKIKYLDPKGKWSMDMPVYKMGNIRSIEFDTDYINSLLLVGNSKKARR